MKKSSYQLLMRTLMSLKPEATFSELLRLTPVTFRTASPPGPGRGVGSGGLLGWLHHYAGRVTLGKVM